jgi:hypothetical protein
VTTPAWQAAENGPPGYLDSTNQASQLNQLLGSHAVTSVYQGTQILTPAGGTQYIAYTPGNQIDLDQPFTLSGTSVSRVVLPVVPYGNGADMLVTLFPDNGSGSPLQTTPLAAATLSAAVINELAAPFGLENATGALQTQWSNTMYASGSISNNPWAGPTGDLTGVAESSTLAVSGSYFIFLGGFTTTSVAGVAIAQYLGSGQLSLPASQPALPQASFFGSATTTSSAVIYAGGNTSTAVLSAVWVASWDSSTGAIGAWSQQTALPVASQSGNMATWNNTTVYYIGGENFSNVATNAVYQTTISNGQLGSWTAGPPFPTPIAMSFTAVIGNWLIVAGGQTAANVATAAVYYSAINPANGSLGPWQAGPPLPVASWAYAPGWDIGVTDNALIVVGGSTGASSQTGNISVLTVTAAGLAPTWQSSNWFETGVFQIGAFPTGNGGWDIVDPNIPSSSVHTTHFNPVPYISVPLVATGLTNGNTYHVVVQLRQTLSETDYLAVGIIDDNPLPDGALRSTRHSGSWSSLGGGYGIPMGVYNNSNAAEPIWHTWEDPSASNQAQRWSSLVYEQPANLFLGITETTLNAANALNSNPAFTSGVAPWTAVNGTITQSNAQTHGGFPFSGLLTPTGGFASAYAQSEEFFTPSSPYGISNDPAIWYLVTGYFYTPTTWANFSLTVNWYDGQGNFLRANSNTVSLPGATWTSVSNYFDPFPDVAYGRIVPTMSGTPTSSNTLYMSNVYLALSPESVPPYTSVTAVQYQPTGIPWPPTGAVQLN